MSQLCIVLDEPLFCTVLQKEPGDYLTVSGRLYRKRIVPDYLPIFYDWIMDADGLVRALEIHLPPDDPLLQAGVPMNALSQVDGDPFVRIWLGEERIGDPQGKEAFGDLSLFKGNGNKLAIVVGLDEWLSPKERDLIENLLFKSAGGKKGGADSF